MIAKADRVDGKGSVQGYYTYALNQSSILEDVNKLGIFTVWEIDSLTLKYSFDDSKSWYSEEEIQNALNISVCNLNIGKEIK